MAESKNVLPVEVIANKIYLIRGQKVMLDRDLAQLYGVETRVLNQAVRRNIKRFPPDFMFRLTPKEWLSLRSQIVILEGRGKHPKYMPFAFTEHGILMLSSVLNSEKAIQVNIQIMRTFSRLREMAFSYKRLKEKIENLESKYDKQFRVVFEALRSLLEPPPEEPKRRIGFCV